jgi:hypothetical protein
MMTVFVRLLQPYLDNNKNVDIKISAHGAFME